MTEVDRGLVLELKTFAESNVVPHDQFMLMYRGKARPVGDDLRYVRNIAGWRVVFSLENQGPIIGVVRHLSMTGPNGHENDFRDMYYEFGFSDHWPSNSWFETCDRGQAFNIAQRAKRPESGN